MAAYPMRLDQLSQGFLHTLNWMEQAYDERVLVMDIEFEHGNVSLYGHPKDTKQFRDELGEIMTGLFEKAAAEANAWRYW
jgi:hypothetical protein